MEKKKSGSYRRGKQPQPSEKHMKTNMQNHDEELRQLVNMREDQIDTSDIPEVKDWTGATIGRFYRPIKEPVTVRLDADVLAWLKSGGRGYQTRINSLLRDAMTGVPGPIEPEHTASGQSREFRFPSLEEHGELDESIRIAACIETRHCVFASAA